MSQPAAAPEDLTNLRARLRGRFAALVAQGGYRLSGDGVERVLDAAISVRDGSDEEQDAAILAALERELVN